MTLTRLPLLLLLAIGLTMAGCGGDDGDDSGGGDASSEFDSGDGDSDGDGASGGDGEPSDLGLAADFALGGDCSDAIRGFGAVQAGPGLALGGAAAGQVDVDSQIDALDDLVAAAPDELSDEFSVIGAAYEAFFQAIVDADLTPGEQASQAQLEALQEAVAELDTDDVEAAVDSVEQWFVDNCG